MARRAPPRSMKAVRIHSHGGSETLRHEDVERPAPGPGEVLIRVRACALNHLDIWVRQGLPGIRIPMPHIPGSDVSGTVEEVGPGVRGIEAGVDVLLSPGLACGICPSCLAGQDNLCLSYTILGFLVDGGYAQYVKVPAANVVPRPVRLSFEEAASVPLVFLTAWHMLVTRARLKPGEDVLVQAAGSGVGIAAIQIAKLFRARVIATASTDQKLAKARALGADEVVNYVRQDFYHEVKRITDRKGVDVVIDHVGQSTFDKGMLCLSRDGRMVVCGATTGPTVSFDLRYLFSRHLSILGSYMGSKGELLALMPFFEDGRLVPVVDRTYPLERAGAAHDVMMRRDNFGKLVLSIA